MVKVAPENIEQIAMKDLLTPELRVTLDEALGTLSEKQRDIFTSHFLDSQTYFDLSLRYQIPEKRVGVIIDTARRKLSKNSALKEFLDIF
jgi:RNA polymerase sigma factor (sigma-70 family)